MGFNGGGGGQLLNHEHDGTLALDGGPLDFKNITQSSMSAGSLCFSDGAHLQERAIGAASDVLTVAGGVPTWAPHGVYPVMELLATYTEVAGGTSNVTIAISPAVDISTEYSELIVVTNLYTNNFTGFGRFYYYVNAAGPVYSIPYGYQITSAPAITAISTADTTLHLVANTPLTTTNSGLQAVTHISLAKTSTTTDTIYMTSDSISDQGVSQHWCNTTDLGTTSVSSLRCQSGSAGWAAGSNISIYGVKS